MTEENKPEPIDKLVAAYLKADGAGVDGRALLRRAQRTRRFTVIRRQVAWAGVAAAVVIVVIAAFLQIRLPKPPPTIPTDLTRAVRTQTRDAASGLRTVCSATRNSLAETVQDVGGTIPAHGMPDLSRVAWQSTKTAVADAQRVKAKFTFLLSQAVEKAGLVI